MGEITNVEYSLASVEEATAFLQQPAVHLPLSIDQAAHTAQIDEVYQALKTGEQRVFAARCGQTIVGLAAAEYDSSPKGVTKIRYMAVTPEHRQQKIGSNLLGAVGADEETHALSVRVPAANTPMVELLGKQGFKLTVSTGTAGAPEVVYFYKRTKPSQYANLDMRKG